MHSPPVEWTVLLAGSIGSLGVLDYLRSMGEADNDTLSEVIREVVRAHPTGPALFTVAVFGGAGAFCRHILKPT